MIQFQISTDVLTYCMHRSRCPYTDKESGKSNPGDQSLLRSDACGSSLPVREEASQQDHLTNADHQKYNGLADGPECNTSVEVLRPTASLCLTKAEVSLVVDDRLQGLMNRHASRFHLSESSDSVLIWEEWRVIANLEVKVHSLVCKGGEFVAEAEPVGAILGCCEGKAVILLLHLFVECNAFWVLQTTVHVIMATGNHLKFQCALGADYDVFVETLLGVVWELKS